MTPGPELAELLAYSDGRDAELAARIAARREGYVAGLAQAAAQWQAGYVAAIAELKAVQHELADTLGESAEVLRRRWHACCLSCRRGGHRTGCRDCQDRTRATFADPMPDDYMGGPVEWAPVARAAA